MAFPFEVTFTHIEEVKLFFRGVDVKRAIKTTEYLDDAYSVIRYEDGKFMNIVLPVGELTAEQRLFIMAESSAFARSYEPMYVRFWVQHEPGDKSKNEKT